MRGVDHHPSASPEARAAELSALELEPAFLAALARYTCVLSFLEEALEKTSELTSSAWIFPLLDELVAAMDHATRAFSDDPGQRERKRAHITAFRAAAGKYVWQSPFHAHTYEKPRGYAGDYETMERMYASHGHPSPQPLPYERAAGPGSALGQVLERHFLQLPGPESVRSRRAYLGEVIRRAASRAAPLRVLSLACGPARELCDVVQALPHVSFDMTLLDQDADALACAGSNLDAVRSPAHLAKLVHAPVRSVRDGLFERHEPFDVIYATGLYDYLRQDFGRALTTKLAEHLAPGGEIVIGNYSREKITPERFYIEYVHDWFLTYRSRDQMLDLARDAQLEQLRTCHDSATGTITFLRGVRG